MTRYQELKQYFNKVMGDKTNRDMQETITDAYYIGLDLYLQKLRLEFINGVDKLVNESDVFYDVGDAIESVDNIVVAIYNVIEIMEKELAVPKEPKQDDLLSEKEKAFKVIRRG